MQADPEFLRQHYRSLSDDAILAVERTDLTSIAQKYYDAEVASRGLVASATTRTREIPRAVSVPPDNPADEEDRLEVPGAEEKPEWVDEADEVYSAMVLPGADADARIADARQALEAAEIPCYLEMVELTIEEKTVLGTHRWRLLTPGSLTLRAMSVLERDLANPEFEEVWKRQLAECPDEELPAMDPQIVLCGLFDRVDRATRAFEEEIARRGLKADSR